MFAMETILTILLRWQPPEAIWSKFIWLIDPMHMCVATGINFLAVVVPKMLKIGSPQQSSWNPRWLPHELLVIYIFLIWTILPLTELFNDTTCDTITPRMSYKMTISVISVSRKLLKRGSQLRPSWNPRWLPGEHFQSKFMWFVDLMNMGMTTGINFLAVVGPEILTKIGLLRQPSWNSRWPPPELFVMFRLFGKDCPYLSYSMIPHVIQLHKKRHLKLRFELFLSPGYCGKRAHNGIHLEIQDGRNLSSYSYIFIWTRLPLPELFNVIQLHG